MKRLPMIMMAALLFVAMSCKKNEEEPVAGDVLFRAYVDAQGGNGKTHLDTDGKKVLWDANDAIRVVTGSNKHLDLTVVKIYPEDGSKADFVSNEHGTPQDFYTPDYRAYYPSSLYDLATGKVALPAEQPYKPNSFCPGYNPMAAQSDDEELYFRNICGVLVLQLTGTFTVDRIRITSKDGELLSGTGTLGMTGYDGAMEPTLVMESGSPSVTLKCNGAVTLTSEPTLFYIVLPPVTLAQGFKVEVFDDKGNVWERSSAASFEIRSNTIKKMAVQNVIVVPPGALPGLFSVSDTKKVYFSQGNLQFYTGSVSEPKSWRFAENQWDMCDTQYETPTGHHSTSDYAENTGKWIDLFGWGTSGWNYSGSHATCTQPWSTSNTNSHYYAYGSSDKNLFDGEGIDKGMADWGMANSIINGGNTSGTWRTLNKNEWYYLVVTRKVQGGAGYNANVTINGVNGIVIFCDDYVGPTDNLTSIPEGCLFLPLAGYRDATEVHRVNTGGYYWASSNYSSTNADRFRIINGTVFASDNSSRHLGLPVRLVQDANEL